MRIPPGSTTEDRFRAKMEPCPMSGCWLWTDLVTTAGYGRLWNGERVVAAHRWAFERYAGPIPEGLQLDHLCRVRVCVNPDHLEVVTTAENTRRGQSPTTIAARKNQCFRGHDLSGARKTANGHHRVCPICQRERAQRRYAKLRHKTGSQP